MNNGSLGDGPERGAPLTSPGARWTRQEEEELVAAVRAGTDLDVIAEYHGRTRGGIESRLLKMIPAGEDIPEDERLGWIVAKLADPCFDWHMTLIKPRPGERGSRPSRTPPASGVDEVLDIWQKINGAELTGERRARFLASPALRDLMQHPADVLRKRGHDLYQVQGRLLLDDWAAECAMPGVTDLPTAADLRRLLATTGETVRRIVAAAVTAIPNEGDRRVLERRLGLSAGEPQTLEQIGADLGVSRERIRQRVDRAAKEIAAGRARAGYRALRARAGPWLSRLISSDDGTVDQDFVLAVAELAFPRVESRFAARVIGGIASEPRSPAEP